MDIKPTSYRYDGEGIECAYRNEKWVVCIKNWKPNNDIDGLEHLEIHHTTDEQFILISGKCIIITADRIDGKFNIELTPVEKGSLYNVPKERWFFTIVEKDTKMMYVQDAGCSMDNSEYCKLSQEEISYIQKLARPMLAE